MVNISRRPLRWTAVLLALTVASSLAGAAPAAPASAARGPDVRISELTNSGPAGSFDNFIELANFGDAPADLDGWRVYRCAATGSRVYDPQVPPLAGVTLAPGETFVIAHVNSTVAHADARYSISLANVGFGVWLEDAERRLIDAVAVYAAPTDSECGPALPNVLDARRGQSYQRVATTGDVTADFIKAARTAGAPNVSEPDPGVRDSDVLVSELTNGGPAGSSDNFVELANFGDQPVDVGGWRVYRCTADGRRHTSTLQATLPEGTTIAPSAVFVAAHDSVAVPDGVPHVRYPVSLANAGFGALIEDADGEIVDAVAVYEDVDSPCAQGTRLPNRLDYGFNETYQRFQHTGDNASDFARAERTLGELVIPEPGGEEPPFEFRPVRISELAHGGPEGRLGNFFELANFSDEPVSLRGWRIHRCQADGRRNPNPQIPVIGEVTLEPGETYLAVRSGSMLHQAGRYDAVYGTSVSDDGFGIIVFDANGSVVDRVGVYDVQYSPCGKGLPIANILDTEGGFSFQRYQSLGSDAKDFVAAPRTPGELPTDLRGPTSLSDEELAAVEVAPGPRPTSPELAGPDQAETGLGAEVDLRVAAGHTTGEDVDVRFYGASRLPLLERAARVYSGVTDQAPPTSRRPGRERLIRAGGLPVGDSPDPLVTEAVDGFPYQRFELVLAKLPPAGQVELTWSGRSTGGNELQLYAWNHRAAAWDLLDAAGGLTGGDISLLGTADVGSHVRGRVVELLVQDGPAVRAAFSDEATEPNLGFKDPAEYDFSFGYLTDTQFLSEGYRNVYVDLNRWIVTNQDPRNIVYTFHTGDIVQRWLNGTHREERARDEFAFASEAMGILERGGQPYGVIPGNHDNRWGRTNDLYNEYFPPARYTDQPWYGGSWRPGDNQNHYDEIEVGGAKFLMVYLGYFAGEAAIQWVNDVIGAHPEHNVIVATHEYIQADGTLSNPDNYRWTSLGERYFNEVILPNENVFLVLSGHFHGVALNIKRDVGGVAGRTVVEMLADYQNFERDGRLNAGFLRLLQVDLDAKVMAVNTYAPTYDEHNAWRYDPEQRYGDADDEFTVEIDINDQYVKRVETDSVGVQEPARPLGGEQVAGGGEASVTWTGLTPRTTYAWYVEVRDSGGRSVVSPAWTFTTRARPGARR